jgi:hypothetical protein
MSFRNFKYIKMKKIFLLVVFIQFFLFKGMAQSKITKYCTVEVQEYLHSKIKASFVEGTIDSLFKFKDTTISNELRENIPNFKLLPDLLNFMAAHKC